MINDLFNFINQCVSKAGETIINMFKMIVGLLWDNDGLTWYGAIFLVVFGFSIIIFGISFVVDILSGGVISDEDDEE